jgi:predicted RNase H-like nuclease
MRKTKTLKDTIIFGFDSAWTDNPRKPGAICAVAYDANGKSRFYEPELATFSKAEEFIAEKECRKKNDTGKSYQFSMIALDQSLIVKNAKGMRPVEKIAGAAVGWAGGGVQPSNKSRKKMFDENAGIWKFLSNQEAILDANVAKSSLSGRYIIEVFPALALLGLNQNFFRRNGIPRYNPANQNFNIEDWQSVCNIIAKKSNDLELNQLSKWAVDAGKIDVPRKKHQDMLDAAICALIGVIWITCEDSCAIMIGNMETGYIVTPIIEEVRLRLENAAKSK